MSSDHNRIKWLRNIDENFNRLSRVHERYRQTTDRQTDDRRTDDDIIANVTMSSRSLKIGQTQSITTAAMSGDLNFAMHSEL